MASKNNGERKDEERPVLGESLPPEIRLILIGKTGNGKSTLGNLLLGQQYFRTGFSMTSTTVTAAVGYGKFRGRNIKVLDTPDISNLEDVDDDRAQQNVSSWKGLTSPQAHVILLAVRCDVRYTREEHQIYLQLKRLWGGNALCRRLIVAFTFGDRQDKDLGEELKGVCPELKQVLRDASQRYVLFNNNDRDSSPEGKERQVVTLLKMVEKLDAEVLKQEERRLLGQVQVCPPGPYCHPDPHPHHDPQPSHPLIRRSSSSGSTSSTGSVRLDCIKLVVVGKPGTGKSSTGNTILGRATFPVRHSIRETIHVSHMEEVDLDGQLIQVIDTPGLQNSPRDKDNDYQQERKRASQLLSPGPHALLYVIRHREVTQDDLQGYRTLKQGLGQGLSHHTILVLVGEASPGGSSSSLSGPPPHDLDEAQREEGEVFPVLLQEAGGKLWAVSNVEVDPEARQRQLNDLMVLLRGILNNSGGDYFRGDQAARQEPGDISAAGGRWSSKEERQEGKRTSCWFL
ncbi:hypothetical protein ACOMHN_013975 [Nucella lapillus]